MRDPNFGGSICPIRRRGDLHQDGTSHTSGASGCHNSIHRPVAELETPERQQRHQDQEYECHCQSGGDSTSLPHLLRRWGSDPGAALPAGPDLTRSRFVCLSGAKPHLAARFPISCAEGGTPLPEPRSHPSLRKPDPRGPKSGDSTISIPRDSLDTTDGGPAAARHTIFFRYWFDDHPPADSPLRTSYTR